MPILDDNQVRLHWSTLCDFNYILFFLFQIQRCTFLNNSFSVLVLQHGYKLNEATDLGAHIGSVGTLGNEPRYIQEPNRMIVGIGSGKRQQGVDIIRTPTTPCKFMYLILL